MVNLNYKMLVNRIPVSRLLKLEVAELAVEVIGIVEKHDPELLEIEPVFDLLKGKMPLINELKVRYGVDPVRMALKPIREKLTLEASAIRLHLKRLSKTTDVNKLLVIKSAVNRHLRYLSNSKNARVLNQKIAGFLNDAENDLELASALEEFEFIPLINNLKLALVDVRMLLSKQVSLVSKRPEKSTTEQTDIVKDAMEDLFKEAEVAQLRNPEIDYVPLVRELNVLMNKYKTTISIREANNKRKNAALEGSGVDAEVDESDNESGQTGPNNKPMDGATSAGVQTMLANGYALPSTPDDTFNTPMTRMDASAEESKNGNANGAKNGDADVNNELGLKSDLNEHLNQKKTAAGLGNQLQQPNDSNDA